MPLQRMTNNVRFTFGVDATIVVVTSCIEQDKINKWN